jgi:phospholipase C
MTTKNRREFLRTSVAGAAGALIVLPAAIEKALAIEAHSRTRSISDPAMGMMLADEAAALDGTHAQAEVVPSVIAV